jgi:ankyrin repeat protein
VWLDAAVVRCCEGAQAVVKLLLEKGADLESKDTKYSQMPLSWAAEREHKAVVKLLLKKGADPESTSSQS